jgi:hypothetical protein
VLEPDEGKLSSPVLRGVGSREAPLLPGKYAFRVFSLRKLQEQIQI